MSSSFLKIALCLQLLFSLGAFANHVGKTSRYRGLGYKQQPFDVGQLITFGRIDPMGQCALIYGGQSLGSDKFLIQDCGSSTWRKKWKYDHGVVKRMAFVSDRLAWFVIGRDLVKIEMKSDSSLRIRKVRKSSDDQNVQDVFFWNERVGWICGDDGLVFKTDDGGITWNRQQTNTNIVLRKVRFVNALEGWISGSENRNGQFNSILLTTRDGGAHWKAIVAPQTTQLYPAYFTSLRHGCAVDENSALRCTNNGIDWRRVNSDYSFQKNDIFFLNNNLGWVAGDRIWRTRDGGQTWRRLLSLPTDQRMNFEQVVFVNRRLGWARTLRDVWRTSDGGQTWSRISDGWIRRLRAE